MHEDVYTNGRNGHESSRLFNTTGKLLDILSLIPFSTLHSDEFNRRGGASNSKVSRDDSEAMVDAPAVSLSVPHLRNAGLAKCFFCNAVFLQFSAGFSPDQMILQQFCHCPLNSGS